MRSEARIVYVPSIIFYILTAYLLSIHVNLLLFLGGPRPLHLREASSTCTSVETGLIPARIDWVTFYQRLKRIRGLAQLSWVLIAWYSYNDK